MESFNFKKCNVPFGIVPNELLNNKAISMKSKGLFAFMQSKPEGWNFSVEKIAFQCKESKLSISEGLKELEIFGFLAREKQQSGKGFLVNYSLFFESIIENPIYQKPIIGIPIIEIPMIGIPSIRKSANNSNKYISKKELIKKGERDGVLTFFETNSPSEWENFQMRFRKKFSETEWEKFKELFECKSTEESLEFTTKIISARLTRFAINYCENLDKDKTKFGKPIIEQKPAYMLKPLS